MDEKNPQEQIIKGEEANQSVTPEFSQIAEQTADPAPKAPHHAQIYDVLTNDDEIGWRSLIFELIKSEQMDPWDVDVSKLAKTYISTLKKLKEMNLRVSGKVLLAAALLLRIKSSRLVGDDMMEFDRLLASGQNPQDLYAEDQNFVEGEFNNMGLTAGTGQMGLVPRTPQPRKRKVSVYDLIDALAIALNVRRRRILNQIQTTTMAMPEKKWDISKLMDDLYADVENFILQQSEKKVSFSSLVPGESKLDKVFTFVPLLHLTNARKVDLDQKDHFGEIWVSLPDPDAPTPDIDYSDMEPKKKKSKSGTKRAKRTKKETAPQESAQLTDIAEQPIEEMTLEEPKAGPADNNIDNTQNVAQ